MLLILLWVLLFLPSVFPPSLTSSSFLPSFLPSQVKDKDVDQYFNKLPENEELVLDLSDLRTADDIRRESKLANQPV
jgi:hypothetical protein